MCRKSCIGYHKNPLYIIYFITNVAWELKYSLMACESLFSQATFTVILSKTCCTDLSIQAFLFLEKNSSRSSLFCWVAKSWVTCLIKFCKRGPAVNLALIPSQFSLMNCHVNSLPRVVLEADIKTKIPSWVFTCS